jgi:hypothetical protein
MVGVLLGLVGLLILLSPRLTTCSTPVLHRAMGAGTPELLSAGSLVIHVRPLSAAVVVPTATTAAEGLQVRNLLDSVTKFFGSGAAIPGSLCPFGEQDQECYI